MAIRFTSPGSAMTGALFDFLATQEARRRQAMLDEITVDREKRLAEAATANTEVARENAASLRESRQSAVTLRDQQVRDAEVARAGKMHRIGDVLDADTQVPAELTEAQKTLPGRSMAVSTAVPGVMSGAPTTQPRELPQEDTGKKVFTGTADQRQKQETKDSVRRIFESNTQLANHPGISTALQLAEATGDYSGLYGAIAQMTKSDGPEVRTAGGFLFEKDPTTGEWKKVAEGRGPAPTVINLPGVGIMRVPKFGGAATPVEDAQGDQVAGFGDAVTPEWRSVIGRVVDNLPTTKRAQKVATFNRLVTEGNTRELADQIRQTAIEGENVDLKNQVMNRHTMLSSINDVREELKDLAAQGVPTNILTGTIEDVAARLGTSTDPRYRRFSNRLADMLITYRRAATGVAFGEKEQADYARMFPNYKQTLPVNLALLDGLQQSIQSNDASYWTHKLGPEGARLVLGGDQQQQPTADDPAEQARKIIEASRRRRQGS